MKDLKKYKLVVSNDKSCSEVGLWDSVIEGNLLHHEVSDLHIKENKKHSYCWYIGTDSIKLTDEEAAHLINDRLDFINDPNNFMFI